MIPFLIVVGILLFFYALEKKQTNMHLVVFKHGMRLKKIGPIRTLYHSSHISLGMCKTMEWNEHTKLWKECAQLYFCACAKINPKMWVPIVSI
jgi:hypothetical protein